MRNFVKTGLAIVGVAVLALFIWQVWGADGRLGDLFMTIWDGFYGFISSIVDTLRHALNV